MTLDDDVGEREKQMRLVSRFMRLEAVAGIHARERDRLARCGVLHRRVAS